MPNNDLMQPRREMRRTGPAREASLPGWRPAQGSSFVSGGSTASGVEGVQSCEGNKNVREHMDRAGPLQRHLRRLVSPTSLHPVVHRGMDDPAQGVFHFG